MAEWRIRESGHRGFVAELGEHHPGGMSVRGMNGCTMPAFLVREAAHFDTRRQAEASKDVRPDVARDNPERRNPHMEMPRMRTIPKAIAELKALDPDTALSEKALRGLVKKGRIKALSVGNRRLVDVNAICEYLANPDTEAPAPTLTGIHPVPLEVRRRA